MKRIIFISLLFITSISYGKTLSDLQTDVRSNIGDVSTDTSKQRYSNTVINSYLNMAQKEIAETTFCIVKSTVITLTANTTYFNLPSDYYTPIRVVYNNDTILKEQSIEILDRDDETWIEFSTSTPTNYYINHELTKIGVYPICSNNSSLELWYIANATDLSNSSDVPFGDIKKYYPYHNLLVYYATGMILLKEGSGTGATWITLYDRGVQGMNSRIKITPNYTPSFGFEDNR